MDVHNGFKVLDHGFVRLVDHMGSDLSVVNAARVSFSNTSSEIMICHTCESASPINDPQAMALFEECRRREHEIEGPTLYGQDMKLIHYLAKHEHTSPFRHAYATLHMKAPLFVKSQVDKHQVGVSINTVSGRYVPTSNEFYLPEDFRAQPEHIKQGSEGLIAEQGLACDAYEQACLKALSTYHELLELGVCREQARMVLPQSMYTEWWMTASLQAWAHFIRLRTDSHAQWEIRQLAEAVKSIIHELFPMSLDCLLSNTRKA